MASSNAGRNGSSSSAAGQARNFARHQAQQPFQRPGNGNNGGKSNKFANVGAGVGAAAGGFVGAMGGSFVPPINVTVNNNKGMASAGGARGHAQSLLPSPEFTSPAQVRNYCNTLRAGPGGPHVRLPHPG
jgi:hypothetical protein